MTLTTGRDAPGTTTLPAITGFHHLGLTVRDIHTSESWYAEVLGMTRAFVEPHPTGGGHTVVMTRPGTTLFLGLDYHPLADLKRFDARRTGLDHLALRLDERPDLDAWVTRLDALGIDHGEVHETDEPVYAAVVFHDPDDIPIELCWSGS